MSDYKYSVLRVAVILAIEDIECGFPEKAVLRLKNILASLDRTPKENMELK